MSCVVYVITNRVNGKRYVGKTIHQTTRWATHVRAAFTSGSQYAIHRAIRKHGKENFDFQVVSEHATEEEAFIEETRLIRELNTTKLGYNMNEGGKGGISPTEEVRQKIVLKATGRKQSAEQRQQESERTTGSGNPMYGRKQKPETLEKMRIKRLEYWAKRRAERTSKVQ